MNKDNAIRFLKLIKKYKGNLNQSFSPVHGRYSYRVNSCLVINMMQLYGIYSKIK